MVDMGDVAGILGVEVPGGPEVMSVAMVVLAVVAVMSVAVLAVVAMVAMVVVAVALQHRSRRLLHPLRRRQCSYYLGCTQSGRMPSRRWH